MKVKKLVVVAMILSLILSMLTVSAQEVTKDKKTEESSIFTENKLIQMYIDQSTDIKILNINNELLKLEYDNLVDDIKDKETSVEDKKEKYDTQKNKSNPDKDRLDKVREDYQAVADQLAKMKKDLAEKKFEMEQLEDNKKQTIEKLTFDLRQQLWSYYTLNKQLELLEKAKDLSNSKLNIEKTKYDLEMATKLDVDKAQNEYDNMMIQIENLKNNVDLLKENIKIMVNIPTNENPEFKIKIVKFEKPVEFDLSTMTKLFKEKSIDLKEEDIKIQAEKDYVDKLLEIYGEYKDDYKTQRYTYQKKVLNKYDYDKNINLMLVNEYYDYKQALESLQVEKDNLDVAEKQFNESKAAYEAGQISKIQLDSAEYSYENSKFNYDKAVIDYNKALTKAIQILKGINQSGGATGMGGAQ